LDDEMSKSLDFGPIPLTQPKFDVPYFDLTCEAQTVDVEKAQTVDEAQIVTESAAPTKSVTVEPTQMPAQTTAQKYASSQTVVVAQKECTYMDAAASLIMTMDHDKYIPVVTGEVAPSSHVAIAKLPLHTLDMNSSTIDLTANAEPAQLLPEDLFADTMAGTIANRKVIASRHKIIASRRQIIASRQALLAESDKLLSLADAALPKDTDKVEPNLFEVFEDDSEDEQDNLPDKIDTSREVTAAVQRHSYARKCRCRVDRNKTSGKCRAYICETVGKLPANTGVKCAYSVIYRIRKQGASTYWKLDKANSTFKHVVGCSSVPKMTQDMLANSKAFRRAIVDDKSVNIHNLERAALAPGIIRKSFSKRKLYRAKQQVLLQNAEDYEDRFNKIQEWGEAFTRTNPGSMFSMVRDDGRLCPSMCLVLCASEYAYQYAYNYA
jgi:hypothetical protein